MKLHSLRMILSRMVSMTLIAVLATVTPCGAAPAATPGLTVNAKGILLHAGRPYRGIGVNYFSAFYRTLLTPGDTSYEAGFQTLHSLGIPFCRLMGGGFWPNEQKLYHDNPHEFFRRFDAVVRSAERNHVGLIPSLFWNESTVPDLVGEPVSAWADPKSKTRAYMRGYVRDVVGRYRHSPAVWGWEFGNEFNLNAALPNATEHRPQVAPSLGTPASRSARDEMTYADIRAAFAAFAQEVRRYDPDRIISTGDSFPRESAWHNQVEKTWVADTPAQAALMLRADNPAPTDVISVHAYGDCVATIRTDAAWGRQWGKPLFVGEFGAPGPPGTSDAEFRSLLKAIEDSGVPLAALWVYDFSRQDTDFNVTKTNGRAYQLRAVSEANARLRAEGAASAAPARQQKQKSNPQSGRATTGVAPTGDRRGR